MKPLAKAILNASATVCILPSLLLYWLSAACIGKNHALEGSSQLFATVPGLAGVVVEVAQPAGASDGDMLSVHIAFDPASASLHDVRREAQLEPALLRLVNERLRERVHRDLLE